MSDYTAPHHLVEARDPASKPSRLQQAVESYVLVKNTGSALPLQKPKILSLFGYDGHAQLINNPGPGISTWSVGIQGLELSLDDFESTIKNGGIFPESARGGTSFTGAGSGAATPAYISDVSEPIRRLSLRMTTNMLKAFFGYIRESLRRRYISLVGLQVRQSRC